MRTEAAGGRLYFAYLPTYERYGTRGYSDKPYARVKEVVSVDVTQDLSDRTRVNISVSVTTIDTETPVNLVFPFFFEGGVSQ